MKKMRLGNLFPVSSNVERISIDRARSGEPTASAGSIRIHSAYNPDREAEKFLTSRLKDIPYHSVIVISGAGLGYIDRILQKLRPEARIIAIHLETILYEGRVDSTEHSNSVVRWHPGSNRDIESFLYEVLDETSISGLKVLEWQASQRVSKESSLAVSRALASVIRRYTGNISTTAAFGRLWIRNSFRNYLDTEYVASSSGTGKAVVLAASGPSLERSLRLIGRFRSRFQLWALPSSLPALLSSNLKPDLIIATDPGYWARLHGRFYPEAVPIAMPLSAAPRPVSAGAPLLLPHGIPGEAFLLQSEKWPTLPVPATGTVAATAVEVWKRLSSGPLILAGLDLCWDDLRSHARPHAFDGWLTSRTLRYNPLYNVAWGRAVKQAPIRVGSARTGFALQTYLDWFADTPRKNQIFRLCPPGSASPGISIPGIAEVGVELFNNLPKGSENPESYVVVPSPVDRNRRGEVIAELIAQWKSQLSTSVPGARTGIQDLMYALDPGGVLEMERSSDTKKIGAGERHLERVEKLVNNLESTFG